MLCPPIALAVLMLLAMMCSAERDDPVPCAVAYAGNRLCRQGLAIADMSAFDRGIVATEKAWALADELPVFS